MDNNNTPITLTHPANLIAALPALLGFIPAESVVVVALKDGEVLCSPPATTSTAISHTASTIMDTVRRHRATSVFIVAISSDDENAMQKALATAQIAELLGLDVNSVLHTPSCDGPHGWTNLRTGDSGMTDDYRTSHVSVRLVMDGKAISTARDDLEKRFALTEPATDPHTSMSLLDIARQVHAIMAGNGTLTAELAANIGHAVTSNIAFRDALLTVGSDNPRAGTQLFIDVAGKLRDQVRAEVLTLVVALAGLAGNGALMNVAIETAQRTTTQLPTLIELIDQAAAAGISPTQLAQVIPDPDTARDTIGGDYTT